MPRTVRRLAPTGARPRRGSLAPRRRLPADARRGELLRAAAGLLTTRGPDGVQFAEVAAAAGVTRQLVYRFFASRRALILAVLDDFADELTLRFGRGAAASVPGTLEGATRVFVEAICDTIEAKGAGPWQLLHAAGPDPDVARHARAIQDRLLAPWRARIAAAAGSTPREAATMIRMADAAGRAVLELWCSGMLTREDAIRDATRGVTALLAAFRVPRGFEAAETPAATRARRG
jgi:AcrR family transcriptional regulator